MGARFVGETPVEARESRRAAVAAPGHGRRGKGPRPLPLEIRGVHVTGALASLPGKFREYVGYKRYGLNTIELDVKDEGGEIGFRPAGVPLATTVGATRPFYNPKALVALAHRNGIYMIGRVVCFQDPKLAQGRPDLAIQRRDGSVWTTSAGLGWVNPYDRRVWDYCVSVAEAAADAGFDQIMFDYVRFPSDGDIASAVYPGQDERAARARDRRLRRLREEAPRAEGRPRLDRALRALGHPRPRHRPGAALHLEVRRQHLADVLSGALRRRRARARRARAASRARRCSGRSRTSAAR